MSKKYYPDDVIVSYDSTEGLERPYLIQFREEDGRKVNLYFSEAHLVEMRRVLTKILAECSRRAGNGGYVLD